jgi:hypothetical protein
MADDYGFVSPRSGEVARVLLDLAEKQGLEPYVVRSTIGGYYVPVSIAKAYENTLGAPKEAPAESAEKSDFPDEAWKVADIKEWASAHEVDLGDATKKADLLAAIQSADKEE